uniref:Uncharacterized protein n=1 Tax=Anguilla anguilla TaxID=7936 RepID=A0A0E9TID1_ANGAN
MAAEQAFFTPQDSSEPTNTGDLMLSA